MIQQASLFEQAVQVTNDANKMLSSVMEWGSTVKQYPIAPARKTDPDTSQLAANQEINLVRWGTHRARLLATYYGSFHGLTDEESAAIAGLTPPASSSPWKRSSELRDCGFIEDTGLRSKSSFGSEVMICKITPRGMAVYEESQAEERAK